MNAAELKSILIHEAAIFSYSTVMIFVFFLFFYFFWLLIDWRPTYELLCS